MLNKIIAVVLGFLLLIFPNSGYLLAEYQSRTFSMDASVNMVMDAIKERDIDTLEAMMCQDIKENTEDLSGEIGILIDAIGGKIVKIYPWEQNYVSSSNDGERSLLEVQIDVIFKTAVKDYKIAIMWRIVDSVAPKETGIRRIVLLDPDLVLTDDNVVAAIRATEYNQQYPCSPSVGGASSIRGEKCLS